MDAQFRTVGDDNKRFWEKVNKTDTCWNWTAGKNGVGYGAIRIQDKQQLAHRVSFEWHYGPIPAGSEVDHLCHNTACVNPSHLRLATSAINGQNRAGAYRNSKSGVRGVTWSKANQKWKAEAMVGGIRHNLGYFETLEEAESLIVEWRREHMPYSVMDQVRK